MGMQVQFQESDLPDDAIIGQMRARVEGSVVISINGSAVTVNSDNNKDFWFDCGSMSELAMETIKWLIQNRICFTAS